MQLEHLWKTVVDNLKEAMGLESFNLWIHPIKPISYDNGTLVLQVPNKYFSDWIKSHQLETIQKIISGETHQDVTIQFNEVQDLAPILNRVEAIADPVPAGALRHASPTISSRPGTCLTVLSSVPPTVSRMPHARLFLRARGNNSTLYLFTAAWVLVKHI